MTSEELEARTRELYEHLRRRISGCLLCETGHGPEGHIPPLFPTLQNLGQEIGWTCELGHTHYLDLLMGASSVRLEPQGILVLDAHLYTVCRIRVSDPDHPVELPGEDGALTFSVRAREPNAECPWWEFHEADARKWVALDFFMDSVIYASHDPQARLQPELSAIAPGGSTIIEAESCSWGCDAVRELRLMQGASVEQEANDWDERNTRLEVGEAVIEAASRFQGEPVELAMEVDGRQIHMTIAFPPREETLDSDDPRVVQISDWTGMARHRLRRINDVWEPRWGKDELDEILDDNYE